MAGNLKARMLTFSADVDGHARRQSFIRLRDETLTGGLHQGQPDAHGQRCREEVRREATIPVQGPVGTKSTVYPSTSEQEARERAAREEPQRVQG
jgi:hypothetical protein